MKLLLKTICPLFIVVLALASCKKDDDELILPTHGMHNVSYGSDPQQVIRFHLPINRSADTTKVAIMFHGENWSTANQTSFEGIVSLFKKQMPNYAFAVINYRLYDAVADTNAFPVQEQDIQAAIDYIQNNSYHLQISNKATIIAQNSGAHLGLLHAYKNNSSGYIKAIAAISPLSNLIDGLQDNSEMVSLLEQLIGGTPVDLPTEYQASSPAHHLAGAIPTILFHGTLNNSHPYHQTMALNDSLTSRNIPVNLGVYATEGEVFTMGKLNSIIQEIETFFSTYNP